MSGSTSAVQGCAQDQQQAAPKTKKIRATLFFDGTLNNMKNTRTGMARAGNAAKHKGDVGTSYGNYYTNVALLFQNINSDLLAGYDKYIPLYIEGIGTTNDASDSTMGYAFGSMTTGVRGKVEKGMAELLKQIRGFIKDKTITIQEIRLDVYGFSRGAAAARHFVNRALNTSYMQAGETMIVLDPIKTALQKEGYKVGTVKVYFVGIYDTVSSLGLGGTAMGLSNVRELGLDAIKAADSVYHLAALDEHRDNFALTNIKSAGGKGKEILLPGVHSDIGGSYNARELEDIQVYDTDVPYITKGKYASIKRELDQLIAGNWFQWKDVQHVKEKRGMKSGDDVEAAVNWHGEVNVKRRGEDGRGIKNQYARIPLRMMKDASKGVDFVTTIDSDAATTLKRGFVDEIILQAYDALKGGVIPASWSPGSANIRRLRYSYLHFSANYAETWGTAPNKPRYVSGQRQRKIHDG
jgi:hypothetical protein